MPRYKIILEYDGSDFVGWQVQPEGRTVQAELEKALSEFGEDKINVIGAGRTDSGVHALGQTAHFDLGKELEPQTLLLALNAKTPEDIIVKSVEIANPDFHARFDATWRKYLYVLAKSPSAIGRRFSYLPPYDYKIELLQSIAPDILGQHDFAAFCKLKSQKENTICNILQSSWTENQGQVVYEVIADRFLHSMVRLLVGTMLDIARGRFAPDALLEILESGDVTKTGTAAPPQGLFLAEVGY